MIATTPGYTQTTCPSCGEGPCHDGTGCNQMHCWRDIRIYLGPAGMSLDMEAALHSIKLRKELATIMRHPRYQNIAPRSPKRGFKKGRR